MAQAELCSNELDPPTPSCIAQHLPPHLVYDILKHFSSCLNTEALNRFPWYLAHICSSWRSEFLSMHRTFWNSVYIWVPHPSEDGYKASKADRSVDVLRMFLERNHDEHSFSFEVVIRRGKETPTSRAPQIMDMLISASARWRRATLDVNPHDVRELPRIKNRVDQLESMVLLVGGARQTSDPYVTKNADTFLNAPYLTRLTIYYLSTWNFNWEKMTLLEFQMLQGEEMGRLPLILSQTVQLETLIAFSSIPVRSDALITLPNLKLLKIGSVDLLSIITTPILESLTIAMTVNSSTRSPMEITESFFLRSRCQIQDLEIIGWVDSTTARDVLSQATEITHLTLYNIPNITHILKLLNDMQAPLLTRLQSLSLIECHFSSDEVDEVFKFVSQRKTRIENKGSVIIEKLRKLTFAKYCHEAGLDGARRKLRKQCKADGIRYFTFWCTPIWHAHDESQDPYDHSQDFDEYLFPESDESDQSESDEGGDSETDED